MLIIRNKLQCIADAVLKSKTVEEVKNNCPDIPVWEFHLYWAAFQEKTNDSVVVGNDGEILEIGRYFFIYKGILDGDWIMKNIEELLPEVDNTTFYEIYRLIFTSWTERMVLGVIATPLRQKPADTSPPTQNNSNKTSD